MKFVGEIEVIKEYDDGYCQIVYQGKNTIAEGMAYALANVLTTISDDNLDNFGLAYFQVGIGNLSSNFPANYTNKSFYQLQSPLSLSDYGSNTIQELTVLDQIVSENGNFQYPIEYTTTSAAFIGVTKENKTIVSPNGISTRLVLDKTMGNGKAISEVGLFINNADAYPNKNTPILAAYKSFSPITKTSDFNLIILWKIIVEDVGNNNLGFLGINSKNFYVFDFASGLGDLNTGTDHSDSIDLGIPATYDYDGTPLVVTFHSLGNNQNQWRQPTSYRVAGYGPSSMYNKVLDKGWFYLGVHGTMGSSGYFGTNGNNWTAPSKPLYLHGDAIRRNWNSKQTFDGFYKILQYIVNHYPIDRKRIYFFGFSMGGGCATNYASRMIDASPSALNPAGVVALAPALSIKKVWWTGAPSSIGSSPYLPIPVNESLRDFAKPIVFWTAGSGLAESAPAYMLRNSNGFATSSSPTNNYTLYASSQTWNVNELIGYKASIAFYDYVTSTTLYSDSTISSNNTSSFQVDPPFSFTPSTVTTIVDGDEVTYETYYEIDGSLWNSISSTEPSSVPLAYYENLCVDYNFVTSSDFSFSTCTFYNLRHIPYYFQYSRDDVVGGGSEGFLEEPSRILTSALVLSGIHSNYKFVYSSLADVSTMMVTQYNLPIAQVPNLNTHNLYALNQDDAINFISSSIFEYPVEASTIVTRSGKAWYFDVNIVPEIPENLYYTSANYYASSYFNSGLGVIVWSIDTDSNTLNVSGYNNMIVSIPDNLAPKFNINLTKFNITTSNPLRCYNASSINCYPLISGSTRRTRIQLDFNPSKVIFKRYIDGNGTLDPVGEELKLDGTSYSIRPYASGGSQRATYNSSTKIFTVLTVGYYEIYP